MVMSKAFDVLHRHGTFPDLDWTVQHQFTRRRYTVRLRAPDEGERVLEDGVQGTVRI